MCSGVVTGLQTHVYCTDASGSTTEALVTLTRTTTEVLATLTGLLAAALAIVTMGWILSCVYLQRRWVMVLMDMHQILKFKL